MVMQTKRINSSVWSGPGDYAPYPWSGPEDYAPYPNSPGVIMPANQMQKPISNRKVATPGAMQGPLHIPSVYPAQGMDPRANISSVGSMPGEPIYASMIKRDTNTEEVKDNRPSGETNKPSAVPGGKDNSVASKVKSSFLQKMLNQPLAGGSEGQFMAPVGPTWGTLLNPMTHITPVIEGAKTIGSGIMGGGASMIGSGLTTMLPPLLFGGLALKALGMLNRGTHNVRPAQDETVRLGLSGPLSPKGYSMGGLVPSGATQISAGKTEADRKNEKHELDMQIASMKAISDIKLKRDKLKDSTGKEAEPFMEQMIGPLMVV